MELIGWSGRQGRNEVKALRAKERPESEQREIGLAGARRSFLLYLPFTPWTS